MSDGKQVNIGSLIVNVLAKTAGFSLAGPRKEIGRFEAAVNGLSKTRAAITGALAAVAGGIGAARIMGEVRAVTDSLGDLNDFAQRVGIATDKLMGLQYGAKFVGVSAEETNAALQTMTRQIGEAIHGGGKAKDVFEAMGVDLQKLARDKPDQAFLRIAKGINELTSAEEQLRASMRIFGGEGAKMLNFLRQGEQGISKFVKEAKTLGIAISQQDIDTVDALGDAMDKLGAVWQGVKNAVVIDITPAAIKSVEAISEVVSGVKLLYTQNSGAARLGTGLATGGYSEMARYMGGANNLPSQLANKAMISAGVGMSAPAMQPWERKEYAGGVEMAPQVRAARDAWWEATRRWERSAGIEEGFGYIQDKVKRPAELNALSKAFQDALEQNDLLAKVTPDSNRWLFQAGEKQVKGASDALVGGLKKLGDAIKPYESIGKESYYHMMLSKIWPGSKDTGEAKPGGAAANSLLDANTAEGYAALRANLRNDRMLEQQKKQVNLLDQIANNTRQFAVATSDL